MANPKTRALRCKSARHGRFANKAANDLAAEREAQNRGHAKPGKHLTPDEWRIKWGIR